MADADARYDAVADFYVEHFDDALADPATVAVLDLLGSVRGHSILDIACGHGRLTRELARRGAVAVGADISWGLLEQACAREEDEVLGIAYRQVDASAVNAFAGETFDHVTCNWGLSDIDDLDGVAETISRVLSTRGTFVFSILHPCFSGAPQVAASWPPDGGYFREGLWLADAASSGLRRQVGANHRMLSTYLNAFANSGLVVDAVREPAPVVHEPDDDLVPTFFVARCRHLHGALADDPITP